MTLGAGLVLMGCGDDAPATTPAPAPPPPPPAEPDPPAPMAPATPTGLHVDETTQNSITWHWTASEGALGYVVQASMDEMFDDTDTVLFDGAPWTTATEYTATDLEPETTVHVRVAAAAGTADAPLVSEFSDAVSGMSAMPPPEPTPFSVTFSPPPADDDKACSGFAMCPDKDDDEATAMAHVNPKMTVSVNMPGIVSAQFVEGANPIGLIPGDNAPFAYVNWNAMQSTVISPGVTFEVQAVEIGANQVQVPVGNAVLITCGPFECMEGPAAPEISIADSAVCEAWDPTVEIQVGKIDNDVVEAVADDGTTDTDGVDLGIVTSSSVEMTVTHVFSGVAKGTNSETKTTAAKGNNKTLTMAAVSGAVAIDVDADANDTIEDSERACETNYDAGDVTDRPKGCFRLIGPGALGRANAKTGAPNGPDYLSGYSLELSPKGAGVIWGRVAWETDPFEDLTCDSMTYMVADEVDICGMFEDEVDYAIGKGWSPEVVFGATGATNANQLVMWRAPAEMSGGGGDANDSATEGKYFKTVWFDDDLDGKIKNSNARRPVGAGDATSQIHDLYNQNGAAGDINIEMIWEHLTDLDGDPNAGDLGKVDLVSDDDDGDTADVDETTAPGNPDGMADNYLPGGDFEASVRKCTEDDGGDDDDGTICDAVWTRDAEVMFADGTFGCTTTRMVSITCTWDADGGMAVGRNALPGTDYNLAGDDNEYANFLKCEAE